MAQFGGRAALVNLITGGGNAKASFETAINAFIPRGGLVKVSLGGIYGAVFHSLLPIFKRWVMAAEMRSH